MRKTKHNPPNQKAKDEPRFIKFSNVQQNYLSEVRARQVREWSETLESVYRDVGLMEKIAKAPPGTYRLRVNDLSGLDYNPPPPRPTDKEIKETLKKKLEAEKLRGKKAGGEAEGKSQETH